MVRCGVVWFGVVSLARNFLRRGEVGYGPARSGMVGWGGVRPGGAWWGVVWHGFYRW